MPLLKEQGWISAISFFKFYDKNGQIIKSETDTDGNGKVDEWVYQKDGKPHKAEKDTNNDGKPDTWINYQKIINIVI